MGRPGGVAMRASRTRPRGVARPAGYEAPSAHLLVSMQNVPEPGSPAASAPLGGSGGRLCSTDWWRW